MLSVKNCLVDNRYPFILDIAFHVELDSLEDSFPADQLKNKLKLVTGPCHLISNKTWDVHVRFVDFDKINKHLDKQYVKCHSRQLQELVGGGWDRKKGFTFAMLSSNIRIGGDKGINQYVQDVEFATGAYWHCDSERATEAKARDIRSHLADAVAQLSSNGKGVIHVGLETPDGEAVEEERYNRIIDTMLKFDANGKNLRWIYTHLLEWYAPPDASWTCDETIYIFGTSRKPNPEPISNHYSVVVPEDGSGVQPYEHGVPPRAHWLRAPP